MLTQGECARQDAAVGGAVVQPHVRKQEERVNDTMQNNTEQNALGTKLPWTDPEFAATPIADHTQGGPRLDILENVDYRQS